MARKRRLELSMFALVAVVCLALVAAAAIGGQEINKLTGQILVGQHIPARRARGLALVLFFTGGAAAYFLVGRVVEAYGLLDLVPQAWLAEPAVLCTVLSVVAVITAASNILGLMIPVPLALLGALVGVGLVRDPRFVEWGVLSTGAWQPLVGGFIAAGATALALATLLDLWRHRRRVVKASWVLAGGQPITVVPANENPAVTMMAVHVSHADRPRPETGSAVHLQRRYEGEVMRRSIDAWVAVVQLGAISLVGFIQGAVTTAFLAWLLGMATGWSWPLCLAIVIPALGLGGMFSSHMVTYVASRRLATASAGSGAVAALAVLTGVMVQWFAGLAPLWTPAQVGANHGAAFRRTLGEWVIYAILAWVLVFPMAVALATLVFNSWQKLI